MSAFLKKISLVLLALCLSSCHIAQKGTLAIKVTSPEQGTPLPFVKLTLAQVGEKYTDKQGMASWEVDFAKFDHLEISALDENIETLFLPAFVSLNAPQWWQKQEINMVIQLKEIHGKSKETKLVTESKQYLENTSSPEEKEVPKLLSVQENTIYEKEEKNISTIIEKVAEKKEILPVEKKKIVAQEEKPEAFTYYEKSFVIKVQSEERNLPRTSLYSGKSGTKILTFLGETGENGELKIEKNRLFLGDILIAMRKDCKSLVYPFSTGSGKETLTLELNCAQNTPGTELFVQHYAFGIPRGIEKVEIHNAEKMLESSSILGFLNSIPAENLTNAYLTGAELIPTKVPVPHIQTQEKKAPVHIFLGTKTPIKPTVALYENLDINQIPPNSPFRRARREFFSRFIDSEEFIPLIQNQFEKMAKAANIDVEKIFKSGWESTSDLEKEIDFIAHVTFESADKIQIKLLEKTGRTLYKNTFAITDLAAETQGASLFEALAQNIPFEGSMLKQMDEEFTLNLTAKHKVKKDDILLIYGAQDIFTPPTYPIALAQVKEVDAQKSKARYLFKAGSFREKNESLRIVRLPRSQVEEKMIEKLPLTQLAAFF